MENWPMKGHKRSRLKLRCRCRFFFVRCQGYPEGPVGHKYWSSTWCSGNHAISTGNVASQEGCSFRRKADWDRLSDAGRVGFNERDSDSGGRRWGEKIGGWDLQNLLTSRCPKMRMKIKDHTDIKQKTWTNESQLSTRFGTPKPPKHSD